jgi:two-component system LytT family response regulator
MKTLYKVVLVEDEKDAQESLFKLLQKWKNIDVVGYASSIQEAEDLVSKLKPDLVFCDVMLPPYTSFDWLSQIERISFEIIFTTSFEEFAIKAFKLAAIDYILKPIDPEDLNVAMDRFFDRKSANQSNIEGLLKNLNSPKDQIKIALPTLHGYLFVKVGDIIRCESDNTYTTFFITDGRKIIVSKTLKQVEEMLDEYGFFRVHNSHLINLSYLVEYLKGEGGQVKLSDGSVVDVSRRKKEEFLKHIKS